jgi:hypothetical protein
MADPVPPIRLYRTTEIETFYDLCVNYGNDISRGKFLHPDSRSVMDTLLQWANEFNALHAENDWAEMEYMEVVDEFYVEKRRELDVNYNGEGIL